MTATDHSPDCPRWYVGPRTLQMPSCTCSAKAEDNARRRGAELDTEA